MKSKEAQESRNEKISKDEKVILENEKDTKIKELTDDLQRIQAEFENYQKRVERDFIAKEARVRAGILYELLEVLDALNEGIKHEPENKGLEKVKESLVKFLHKNGVQKMDEKKSDMFDHEKMECVMQGNEKEKKDGEVLEILQKGYYINDKVLRFAKVKVNKI